MGPGRHDLGQREYPLSIWDLFRFSLRALRGHRLRTWFSVLGVAIGVASVIMLTSLGEGARLYIAGEFTSLGTNLVVVIPGKTETLGAAPFVNTAPNDLTVADAEAMGREIPEIRLVAPVALGTAETKYKDRIREATVIGTTHEVKEIRGLKMGVGRFLPKGIRDAPVCVLGARIQRELFGNQNPLGETIRIGGSRFRVVGVIAARGTTLGMNMDDVIEIPVDSAMRLFNRTSLFRIMAEVGSSANIETAKTAVIDLMVKRHGEEDITVLTQDAVLSTFGRILSILTLALAGIAAISLSVAGIGIMNVMLVSVSERTREIGLLKALGTTRRQILSVFLIEAAIISSAGGLLGFVVGIGAGQIAQQIFPAFPAQPPLWAVLASLGVSIGVGVLFGALPARNASRLDPIVALMRRRA